MRHMSRLFRANFSEKAHFRQLWIARCAPVQSGQSR
jgi:ribosomal protein L20